MKEESNYKIKKIIRIVQYILGMLFIIGGIGAIKENANWFGIFLILLGLSIWPILYEKLKLKKIKDIRIILPIILFIATVAVAPRTQNNIEENEVSNVNNEVNQTDINNIVQVDLSGIEIKENQITMDVKEEKSVEISIEPLDATNKGDIRFNCEDNSILNFIIDDEKSKDNLIYGKIIPIKEGNTKIFLTCGENIRSNIVEVNITNTDVQNSVDTDNTTQNSTINNTSSTKTNTNTINTIKPKTLTTSTSVSDENSKTVYITPTGKRYHFDPDCGGKNSYTVNLSEAINRGFTPCQKCAK